MGRLDDMAILAKIAESESLTAAGRALDLPKQTVSRRLQELERAVGVQLLQRTTRRVKLTDAGVEFARRCQEIVRLRDEATLLAASSHRVPRGLLRITADVLLGERFIAPLVNEFLLRYPETRIEFVATRQFLDLVDGGSISHSGSAIPGLGRCALSPSVRRKCGTAPARSISSAGDVRTRRVT